MSTRVYIVEDPYTGNLGVFSTLELAIEAGVKIYFDHYRLDGLDNCVEDSRRRSVVSVKDFLADMKCLSEERYIGDLIYITEADYDYLYWRNENGSL